jgi:hypothetical protein
VCATKDAADELTNRAGHNRLQERIKAISSSHTAAGKGDTLAHTLSGVSKALQKHGSNNTHQSGNARQDTPKQATQGPVRYADAPQHCFAVQEHV